MYSYRLYIIFIVYFHTIKNRFIYGIYRNIIDINKSCILICFEKIYCIQYMLCIYTIFKKMCVYIKDKNS